MAPEARRTRQQPGPDVPDREALQADNESLRARLAEAEETLDAIRNGHVDALTLPEVLVITEAARIIGEKDPRTCKQPPPGKPGVKLNLAPGAKVADLIAWIASITCMAATPSAKVAGVTGLVAGLPSISAFSDWHSTM